MHSQTAEYALRAMACLAQYRELVATPSLADQTGIPSNYLAKVLQLLAGANLISGRRGVGGGYRLARSPEEVTLLHVIDAVDPMTRIQRCPVHANGHAPSANGAPALCALHRRMDTAIAAAIEIYRSTTLRDLLNDDSPIRPVCRTATDTSSGSNGTVARASVSRMTALPHQHPSNGTRHSASSAGQLPSNGVTPNGNGVARH